MIKILLTLVLPVAVIYFLMKYNTVLGLIATALYIAFYIIKNLSDIFMMRGAMLYGKNPVKGMAKMKKGFSFKRVNPKYAVYYAYVCLREGEWEEAKRSFEKIDKMKLSEDDMLRNDLNKSLYYWKNNRIDDAINILEKRLSEGEGTAIYINLGFFYLVKKDFSKALEINKKAYEYNKNDEAIADNLAYTYYLMGDKVRSRDMYAELTENNLKIPIPYYHYGELLADQGETEQAIEMMEKSLEYNFTHLAEVSKKYIRERLSKLQEKTN